MTKLSDLNISDIEDSLDCKRNPLTGGYISTEEIPLLADLIYSLYSLAIEQDFEPKVNIPGFDESIKIVKNIPMYFFTKKIEKAFENIFFKGKIEMQLSQQNISFAIYNFLIKVKLIEKRRNENEDNLKYRATVFGISCGISEVENNNNITIYYPSYIQTYIIHNLPQIFKSDLYEDIRLKNKRTLCNSIEPLTTNELDLLNHFRTLSSQDKLTIFNILKVFSCKSLKAKKLKDIRDLQSLKSDIESKITNYLYAD